jgi:molecular chaperone GrpE
MTKQNNKEDNIKEKDVPEEAVEQKEESIIKEKEVDQAAEYLNSWKRCQADFENYRKLQSENGKQLMSFATENLVLQMLPILDNFHASTDHIPEEQKNGAWVVGIMHIQKQLETFLKDNGVEEIETKIGDKFSPEIHEALSHGTQNMEHGTKKEEDKIEKIVAKGYRIGNKVIRAVKVVVN